MMKTVLQASLVVIGIALAMQLADAARGNKKLPVNSFDGIEALFAHEVEGISLNTPKGEVGGILESKGYSLNSENGNTRVFTKGVLGQGNTGVEGELGYVMQVTHSERQTIIYFYRPPPQTTHAEARNAQPLPIPDSIDAKEGAKLRALICENLTDAKEQHRLCMPPTEMDLGFGKTIKLLLRKNPMVTVSVDIRGRGGHLDITSYH